MQACRVKCECDAIDAVSSEVYTRCALWFGSSGASRRARCRCDDGAGGYKLGHFGREPGAETKSEACGRCEEFVLDARNAYHV